jgi:teichuronic acid exporter
MDTLSSETSPKVHDPESDLDGSFFRGIAWVGGTKWLTQLLAWASTLIVARLLTPGDYGLVTMATVYLGLVEMASEFGIGTTVVTLRDLSLHQLEQLNSFCVLLGIAGFALSFAAAKPLEYFFKAPQLPVVVIVLSASFVIASFQVVPSAFLQKELDFKKLSIISAVRALANSVALVTFAILGFRYWTLVLAALLSATMNCVLTLCVRRCGFRCPNLRSLQHAITFSWHILVNRISWYIYSNADFAVAGRTLGQLPLGAYTVAWNLANTPISNITSFVSGVMPAVLSAMQTEYALLRRYILNLSEGLALITFPLTIGLALVANDAVLLVLGQKWQAAVGPLRLLAIFASVRSVTPVLGHALNVIRETRFGMKLGLISVVLYPTAFYIGSRWGTVGIAAAWILIHPVMLLPLYVRVFEKVQLAAGDYFRALRPGIEGSITMSLGVLLLKPWLVPTWPLALRLALQVITGGILYIGEVMIFHRGRIFAIYRRIKLARTN